MGKVEGSACRQRRRGRGRLSRLAPVLALLPLAACATTVRPPHDPADPVEVFLVDLGRTPTLVLPAADGEMTRWAYGDWRWYARGETSLFDGLAALLWPTRAGLGREALGGPGGLETVRLRMGRRVEAIHRVPVSRAAVEVLADRLAGHFDRGVDSLVVNPEVGLEFVPHPKPYHGLNNSNHMTAQWLRELGCRVGWPLWSRWRVRSDAGAAKAREQR